MDKTQELKNRGEQLDLLLLKAESYSKFIVENQKRSRLAAAAKAEEDKANLKSPILTGSAKKRKQTQAQSTSNAKTPRTGGKNTKSPSSVAEAEVNEEMETSAKEKAEKGTVVFKQPPSLKGGTLMPYQVEGLQWLLSLWENGLSGILADEMGLGKTIQIISLIAHLRECKTPGPFLICGPLATLPNWLNEFKKWLPCCPVILYHGSKAEREEMRKKMMQGEGKDMAFPVVITSFEICMIDRSELQKYVWQYMILDEGHRIKNRNCKLVKELKQIKTISRLLLTGTPIQNTLEELWSLLNFCSPQIFDDLEVFQSWFGFKNIGRDTQVDDIVQTEQKQRVVTKLHDILRPFLLRRMKRDVLLHMPPKKEIVIYCGMSALQREYSLHIQSRTLRAALVNMKIEGAKDLHLLNPVMQVRTFTYMSNISISLYLYISISLYLFISISLYW